MKKLNDVTYLQLSGSEFEDCVTHWPGAKLFLKGPKLKYYQPWRNFFETPSREVFLAVTKTRASKEYSIIGMIELQDSPYEKNETWLMFISVDPHFSEEVLPPTY